MRTDQSVLVFSAQTASPSRRACSGVRWPKSRASDQIDRVVSGGHFFLQRSLVRVRELSPEANGGKVHLFDFARHKGTVPRILQIFVAFPRAIDHTRSRWSPPSRARNDGERSMVDRNS